MSNPYVIPAVCFIGGMIFQCILCKLFRKPCQKQYNQSYRKPAMTKRREEKPFEQRKPHPAPADGSIEIYVGNLSYETTEAELRQMFEAYGKVNACRLVTNKFNGRSKGFGFIQMPNRDEVEKACAELNDKEIQGRKIKCNVAKNTIQ